MVELSISKGMCELRRRGREVRDPLDVNAKCLP